MDDVEGVGETGRKGTHKQPTIYYSHTVHA